MKNAQNIKNVICPACGKIAEKKEFVYLLDVLSGETKENCIVIKEKIIHGLEFCAVCR